MMDPITLGMVSIGVAGGSLCVVSALSWFGVKVNEDAIKLALVVSKYGGIFYLLEHLKHVFF